MDDIVAFIVQNIQQNASNQDIILQLQNAGYDDESISEAFADAYAELSIEVVDESLGQLARPVDPFSPQVIQDKKIRQTKIIGVGVLLFGVALMILVGVYLFSQASGPVGVRPDLPGELTIPPVPPPQTQRVDLSTPVSSSEETGDVFIADEPLIEDEVDLQDARYRAFNFTDSKIEFEDLLWLFSEDLCLGEPLKINWYASFDITDVVLGIYQPGFGEPEIKTIGSFRATNNPEWVPGYGTYFWAVGVIRDGSVLIPGSGYRFVLQDADGDTKVESNSFKISQCP